MEKKVYYLKSASINGYVYTKTYYRFDDDGKIVKSDSGNDNDLTVINIFKKGTNPTSNEALVIADGYIGVEKTYNPDGTKAHSVTRKNCFGLENFIKYTEGSEGMPDNCYAFFLSDTVSSEKQAELFAQAIRDISQGEIEKTYMWCHSKAALNGLRAIQKMRDTGKDEDTLEKISLTLSGIPINGLDSVNRTKVVYELDKNPVVNLIPFSGFFKTAVLAFYDKYLYKPTPAQVDLKLDNPVEEKSIQVERGKVGKIFDTIWGNNAFRRQIAKEKQVDYDKDYLRRVKDNMEKIQDIDFKTIPLDINLQSAINSAVKEKQLMPLILYLKKMVISNGEKGDGIVKLKDQGFRDRLYHPVTDIISASHDVQADTGATRKVAKYIFREEK